MAGRFRAVFRWTLLCLWSVGVALVVAEAGMRLFGPQPVEVSVPVVIDPDLIYRLPPHARGTDVKEEFAVRIETNSQGLRDREYSPTPGDGVLRRVLVLGGSMTFAEGVEAEQTFPKVLEHELARGHGPGRFEVINAAIRGYGTDQELILFERLIPIYRPDEALLAFFSTNDFDDSLYGNLFAVRGDQLVRLPLSDASSPKYRYYRRQAFIEAFPGHQTLMRHSHLVNFIRRRWSALEHARIFRAPSTDNPEEREERAWRLTRMLLVAWRETARRHGIEPRLLVVPSWEQVSGGGDARAGARTARVIALARELAVPLVDPIQALRAAARGSDPVFYAKDRHMTAAGHRVVAQKLQECLFARRARGGRPAVVPEGCIVPKGWGSLAFLDFPKGIWENRPHP